MKIRVEGDYFIWEQFPFHQKEDAKKAGAHWSRSDKRWLSKANLLTSAVVRDISPEADVTELDTWNATVRSRVSGFPLRPIRMKHPPMRHQITGAARVLNKKRVGLFYEMGCVDGDAIVQVNRARRGFKIKLQDLYKRFNGNDADLPARHWNPDIPTYVKSMCDGIFRQHQVKKVLYKGVQEVMKLVLKSGKSIRVTSDHEIAVPEGRWTEVRHLKKGDVVLTNGIPSCAECGSIRNVVINPQRRFCGFCLSCIRSFTNGRFKSGKFMDDDGYIRVSGMKRHPRANLSGQVYEHILVMEEELGRFISTDEAVHHINEIKHDNRAENLEVKTRSDHASDHGRDGGFLRLDGSRNGRVRFIPLEDEVESVSPDGTTDVYDIVMEDPHRNFVANGIVVHNCGKTYTTLWAMGTLARAGEIRTALILCPLSVIYVWKTEIEKHLPFHVPVYDLGGKNYEKVLAAYQADPSDFKIVLVNYDKLRSFVKKGGIPKELHADFVVADESGFIKSRVAKRTKLAWSIADHAEYVLALNGTPYVNDISDLFAQMRFVDSRCFGTTYWTFAERYIQFDNSPWKKPIGPRMAYLPELKESISTFSHTVRKADVLELPPKTYERRVLIPGGEQAKALVQAEKEFMISVEALAKGADHPRQHQILLANALSRATRCLQISAGHTKNELGQIIHFEDNPKMKALLEISQSLPGRKIVIFSRFIEDLELAKKTLEEDNRRVVLFHGGLGKDENDSSLSDFQKGYADVFCAQVQKGGFGIDLCSADVAVYITNWFSFGVRRQSEDRLHRKGQVNKVLYIDLALESPTGSSVDEKIVEGFARGQSFTDYVFKKTVSEDLLSSV